jgi:predicted DCC family thiol-disulfide oxidoreductase YuxK
MTTDAPVLVYDGVCALCNRAVRFVLHRDRTIRFAPLQGAYADELMARHPRLRDVDSIVFVTHVGGKEKIQTKSDAALAILAHIGWPRAAVASLGIIPRPARDFVYDVIARTRYRVFGRMSSCPVPPPAVRERFIE